MAKIDDVAREAKREVLKKALERSGGNVSQAARDLGVSRHRIDQDPGLLKFARGLRALAAGKADAERNLGPQRRLNEATRRSPRGAKGKI